MWRKLIVIVQSRSQQLLILQREAQRFHEMQRCACVGAEPNDVAGVRRNFRLIENDVEHVKIGAYGWGTIARTQGILIACTIGWSLLFDAIRSSSFGYAGSFPHHMASWYSESY